MSVVVLLIIPLLALVSGLILYRFQGKKEILRMDIVQFFYAFVLSPVVFVWLKSLLFVILKDEAVPVSLVFLSDAIFSTFALYVYAFVVMHSLTKSFHLQNHKDPLYDLFEHSEYYHLWLTHILMYIGVLILFSGLAFVNVLVPLDIVMSPFWFLGVCATAIFAGLATFIFVWLSDPLQENANFMRLMKLAFGFFFLIHAVIYFLFGPAFSAEYVLFWWSSVCLMTLVICSLFVYKSVKAQSFFERVSLYFKHHKWGSNIQLFDK